eukprot:9117730-Lingulodinium_polyedra.AAC.1
MLQPCPDDVSTARQPSPGRTRCERALEQSRVARGQGAQVVWRPRPASRLMRSALHARIATTRSRAKPTISRASTYGTVTQRPR